MKVKDLINRLTDFPMDEEVFIGLGYSSLPDGLSPILKLSDFVNQAPPAGHYGVYIIPTLNLQDS